MGFCGMDFLKGVLLEVIYGGVLQNFYEEEVRNKD